MDSTEQTFTPSPADAEVGNTPLPVMGKAVCAVMAGKPGSSTQEPRRCEYLLRRDGQIKQEECGAVATHKVRRIFLCETHAAWVQRVNRNVVVTELFGDGQDKAVRREPNQITINNEPGNQ